MDLEMANNQLSGLEAKGKELRGKEALFLKDQGLAEEVAKAQKERDDKKPLLADLKIKLADLKDQKRLAVGATATALAKKMGEILPTGKAVFEAGESGVFIGWDKPSGRVPYDGLSGGEKATFDAALCHALKADLIVVEAAEVSIHFKNALGEMLKKLATFPGQVIVNVCDPIPAEIIPENFAVTMVGGAE